jgi:serine/threonine-protein kinase
MKAKDSVLGYRLKLFESKFGRLVFRLTSWGVKPAAVAASAHRPTEVAIGMAAEGLYEALPKEMRRELKDLPAVIKRLEADAQAQRARADELSAVAGGLGDGAPKSHTLTGSAGAVVAEQQAKLAADVNAKREEALRRMASSVAALENLRLDLLRLKAGAGSLDELTAHLSDARRLQEDINVAIEARREADAAITSPTT